MLLPRLRRTAIFLASAFLLLTGCLAAAAAREQLIVWHWDAHAKGDFAQWLEYAKLSFEQKNPEVEVVYQYVPFGPDRFVLAASANVMPDVSIASVTYARDLHESGLLQPLNEHYAATPDLQRALLPVTQAFNQHNGVIYGATNSLEASAILYNHQHFLEAGLSIDPLAIGTWTDLAAIVRKLTRIDSDGTLVRAGFYDWVSTESYAPWLYSNGAAFFNDQQTRAAFNTDRGREALAFQEELWNITGAIRGFVPNFVKGNVSLQRMETAVSHIPDIGDVEFGYTSAPVGPAGSRRGSVAWGNMYVIPKGARHPDLAWDWIAHYLSLESQIKQLEIMRTPFSPRRDVYLSSAWRKAVEQRSYMACALDIFQTAGVYPFYRASAISAEVNPILRQVFSNQLSPATAIEQMESIVNRIVAK
ncbi:MAG: ABC transporter substrate-binding protein [Limnochordia bacterium]